MVRNLKMVCFIDRSEEPTKYGFFTVADDSSSLHYKGYFITAKNADLLTGIKENAILNCIEYKRGVDKNITKHTLLQMDTYSEQIGSMADAWSNDQFIVCIQKDARERLKPSMAFSWFNDKLMSQHQIVIRSERYELPGIEPVYLNVNLEKRQVSVVQNIKNATLLRCDSINKVIRSMLNSQQDIELKDIIVFDATRKTFWRLVGV